jgi:hypothetical protein
MPEDEEHLRLVQEALKGRFLSLPPCELEPQLLVLVKKADHVAFVLQEQRSGERVAVFSLYRREARQLLKRLEPLIDAADGEFTLIEGVVRGGPPRPDQLMPPRKSPK